jgi:hypothetical protein
MLADAATLPTALLWFVRIGVPLAAILISAGFFLSVLAPTATQASGAVSLIYVGALVPCHSCRFSGHWLGQGSTFRLDSRHHECQTEEIGTVENTTMSNVHESSQISGESPASLKLSFSE